MVGVAEVSLSDVGLACQAEQPGHAAWRRVQGETLDGAHSWGGHAVRRPRELLGWRTHCFVV
eukprot:4572551-Lingulodinium_polyedra.AAC.1